MKQWNDADVVVVGGGHAGVEAAHAAARMGATVVLVTHNPSRLGEMSCNPAIGGIGKGHLVREIDALDGVMARAADAAGIQFRLLNATRGPAVHGPRAQCDRSLYRNAVQTIVSSHPNIRLLPGTVDDLIVRGTRISGVGLAGGQAVCARSTILTTGTFLNGVMHTGGAQTYGGRAGDPAATSLARRLLLLGLPVGRLKTGTPPRLDGRTIAWSTLPKQAGDQISTMLSFMSSHPMVRQIDCAITHTNAAAHDTIRRNLKFSPMFSGKITGAAPRYCPSIEDKVMRFADKEQHQIFLEPEGLDDIAVYPNGISTSLPADAQEEFVRAMPGLERVAFLRHGYAIEYDYVDPLALEPNLSVKGLEGLYLAGQINGTTGYEEAAGQGILAGINAALRSRDGGVSGLSRENAYIGVMIDDLTTRGVTEPYRMFTSRAEFRLSLRIDNADQRLTPLGLEIGCVGDLRRKAFECKREQLDVARRGSIRLGTRGRGESKEAADPLAKSSPEILRQIEIEASYAGYVERQRREAARIDADTAVALPPCVDYSALSGLSSELRDKLIKVRPTTLAQARRIEGMTPSALMLLHGVARRATRSDR